MKQVSYNTAKYLKEKGYPQRCNVHIPYYDNEGNYHYGSQIGCPDFENDIYAPTYIEVWLWLWEEKKTCINCKLDKNNILPMWWCTNEYGINYNTPNFNNQEDAIVAAIEYIVDNDLIK